MAHDDVLAIAFDANLHTSIARAGDPMTPFQASESLLLPEGGAIDACAFVDERTEPVADARHGAGRRHVVRGRSAQGIEKTVEVAFFERYPGMAIVVASYRNTGDAPLAVAGWRNGAHELAEAPGGFWSFSGATHEDRRDWVQPVDEGFNQRNTLAMDASDYGGGTPVANLWRRDGGLAVGHVEIVPKLLDMPVRRTAGGASIAIEGAHATTLGPGESLTTQRTLLCVHTGDFFVPLELYRRFMRDQGIASREVPESAFAPIWCAWGYERDFTTQQVLATLPKARELGFEWAVLDDGWQTNEGDWAIDLRKFPRGDADMRAFTDAVRAQGMRPRLWLAPLAADPGSDVLHQHPDMLLLDEYGSFQKVSWWNALTQCPAYRKTIDYYVAFVKKAIGEWGFEGLKLDGQHLNAVAPCHNPAHAHAHPNESCEKLPDFWNAIHAAARAANPQAVVELCPCGTAFAFHNLPATDQFPSSDPLSSWQVRHKGKTIKALIGRGSSYAGDHVELSTGGQDFASSVGIGAVISTKFTWPRDTDRPNPGPLPPGGFVLTPEKEALWRRWIDLYRQHMLPRGEYLGALYDIGFDRPEAHAIAKDGAMYYAFYADAWNGPLQLRGLGKGRWRVRDLFHDRELGVVDSRASTLDAAFEGFLLLQALPEGGNA
ncbi:glycoside hydrolase family 36 protein [Luteimonas saliphila]|uniref:glycoside hydrolase family 36 protein n=1 Tax=Luteimonas saliphila TaxID=2804919 RepID=UPI0030804E45